MNVNESDGYALMMGVNRKVRVISADGIVLSKPVPLVGECNVVDCRQEVWRLKSSRQLTMDEIRCTVAQH